MKKIILVKYGEIALKGNNRRLYEKQLINNICYALQINRKQILLRHGRIYIDIDIPDSEINIISNQLTKIFGLEGFSFAQAFDRDLSLEHIQAISKDILSQLINSRSQSFKVQVRRIYKRFPIPSMQLAKGVGAHLLTAFPTLSVNLHEPDLCLFIECRDEGIFFYTNLSSYKCYGGLPVGMSGNGYLLLSGGIDSPVAGWMMMKRGMSLDAIHFHSSPFTTEKSKQKVFQLCQQLANWKQHPMTLQIPNFTPIQVQVNDNCPAPFWTIIHRRFMLRVANQIAQQTNNKDKKYRTLVMGDSLSQVASQTIENMATINAVSKLPIIRPLIGLNKLEITQIAQSIGTFDISKLPYSDCCTLFASQSPATKSWDDLLNHAEQNLDIEKLVDHCVQDTETIEFIPEHVKLKLVT